MEGYVRAMDARRAAVMVAVGAAMSLVAVLASGPAPGPADAAAPTVGHVAAPVCWVSADRDDRPARSGE